MSRRKDYRDTQNAQDRRTVELEGFTDKFADLGFDFKAKLRAHELRELAEHLSLEVENSRTKTPLKTDWLFAVEYHYAQERLKAGDQPVDYLHPAFNCSTQSIACIRQILTTYGYKYTDGNNSRPIADLTTSQIHCVFADKIDEMRDSTGYVVHAVDSSHMNNVSDDVERMNIDRVVPPPCNGRRSPVQSFNHAPTSGPKTFPTPAKNDTYTPVALVATTSTSPQRSEVAPSGISYTAPTFGTPWHPPRGRTTSNTNTACIEVSTSKPNTSRQHSPPATNSSQPKQPQKPPIGNDVAVDNPWQHATSSSSLAAPSTPLNSRKIVRLRSYVEEACIGIISAISESSIARAIIVVDQIMDTLQEELPDTSIPPEVTPEPRPSFRSLNQRQIKRLKAEVQSYGVFIQDCLVNSAIVDALDKLEKLKLILEEEL